MPSSNWQRSVKSREAWEQAALRLQAGELALLGLWGEADCVHMALLDEARIEIGVVSLLCPDGRFQPVTPPGQSLPVLLLFLRGSSNHRRHLGRLSLLIQSHVGDKSRTGLLALAREQVFKVDFDRHFNRGAESPRDLCAQDDELPYPDWMNEVQVVHGNRHHHAARVTMSHNCPGNIDQMHHLAAQDVAEWIGIIRQDHFHHFRFGLADCLPVPLLLLQFSTGSAIIQLCFCCAPIIRQSQLAPNRKCLSPHLLIATHRQPIPQQRYVLSNVSQFASSYLIAYSTSLANSIQPDLNSLQPLRTMA